MYAYNYKHDLCSLLICLGNRTDDTQSNSNVGVIVGSIIGVVVFIVTMIIFIGE